MKFPLNYCDFNFKLAVFDKIVPQLPGSPRKGSPGCFRSQPMWGPSFSNIIQGGDGQFRNIPLGQFGARLVGTFQKIEHHGPWIFGMPHRLIAQ